jgi:chemotaxis protein methyltransferase CheR
MKHDDLEFLAGIVRQRSGLVLTADKGYLLESRLSPVARKEGFNSVEELVAAVRTRRDERLMWSITDAMTTNETFFFRDKTPFDLFRDQVMPSLLQKKGANGRIRIWCAAASTGQEPYSLAMVLADNAVKYGNMNVEIIGTDISERVLEKAQAGLYTQFEVQRGLPVTALVKYFEKKDDLWRLKSDISSKVKFKKANLLEDFRSLGQFDVIFCRNVLIYFDQPTKRKVLEQMAGSMGDEGFLFLGAAETVMGITDAFQTKQDARGLYCRTTGWKAKTAA